MQICEIIGFDRRHIPCQFIGISLFLDVLLKNVLELRSNQQQVTLLLTLRDHAGGELQDRLLVGWSCRYCFKSEVLIFIVPPARWSFPSVGLNILFKSFNSQYTEDSESVSRLLSRGNSTKKSLLSLEVVRYFSLFLFFRN